MKGIPSELLLVALFIVVLAFNFLMQRVARQQKAEAAQNEPEPDEIPEEVWRGESALALPPPTPYAAPQRRAQAPTVSPARPGRRFARRTLLGTPRQIQDAFVVATILGRCRGDEQHEIR